MRPTGATRGRINCGSTILITVNKSTNKTNYSITCLGRPPLLPTKIGRSRQVVYHNRSDTNHVLPMCRLHVYTQPGSRHGTSKMLERIAGDLSP